MTIVCMIAWTRGVIKIKKWVESNCLSVPTWVSTMRFSFNFFDVQSVNLHHISNTNHGPCYCSKTKACHRDTVPLRLISIVEAGIWSTRGMGVMFCMLDQCQSADGHFTIEYVYSHASETQDEAKAQRDDCASETDSQAKYDKQQSLEKLLRLLTLLRSLINSILRPTPEGPVYGSFGCCLRTT